MRLLIVLGLAAGIALLGAGAAAPERFVLALVGMAVLVGSAALAQASLHRPGPRPRY